MNMALEGRKCNQKLTVVFVARVIFDLHSKAFCRDLQSGVKFFSRDLVEGI